MLKPNIFDGKNNLLYVGYKFKMSEDGLIFHDSDSALEPNSQIKVENTPFSAGDTFILTKSPEGYMFFKRVDIVINGAEVKCNRCAEHGY